MRRAVFRESCCSLPQWPVGAVVLDDEAEFWNADVDFEHRVGVVVEESQPAGVPVHIQMPAQCHG